MTGAVAKAKNTPLRPRADRGAAVITKRNREILKEMATLRVEAPTEPAHNQRQKYRHISVPLGQRMRAVRAERGLSQKKAGEMFGISKQSVSLYECGNRLPLISTLWDFCVTFECSYVYLLVGTGGPGRGKHPLEIAKIKASDGNS